MERAKSRLAGMLGAASTSEQLSVTPRLCFAVARGGAYCFSGGGKGARTASGLIFERIAFGVLTLSPVPRR